MVTQVSPDLQVIRATVACRDTVDTLVLVSVAILGIQAKVVTLDTQAPVAIAVSQGSQVTLVIVACLDILAIAEVV